MKKHDQRQASKPKRTHHLYYSLKLTLISIRSKRANNYQTNQNRTNECKVMATTSVSQIYREANAMRKNKSVTKE